MEVNVVGAGLAGLSAAITLARSNIVCHLISVQPSERAQSVLAEGGINAALDTMGEDDRVDYHFNDTMRGGCYLETKSAVEQLTSHAPEVVKELVRLGVPFLQENGHLILRNFGGQKKKRTAYAKSSTGKMMMTGLIDEARRFEAKGLIKRFNHHELVDLEVDQGVLKSLTVKDTHTGAFLTMTGQTILCTGGLNGFFKGMTTGTTQNTGNCAAIAFSKGVAFSNLEFIQYHPTTAQISYKRMLVSEAARGEGGRLFVRRHGEPWYFMEDKYPELGNLMPRDVISREMELLKYDATCEKEIYLDLTGLSDLTWKKKLSDLRAEIIDYLHVDPKVEPVPVSPGIHFFMGGIWVDDHHATNIKGLYAAGEAACKYHGANRLGGNSMLGAIYGGSRAAQTAALHAGECSISTAEPQFVESSPSAQNELRDYLLGGLGIIRHLEDMNKAKSSIELMLERDLNPIDEMRCRLGLAMVVSALERKESRGAHQRVDYPDTSESYQHASYVVMKEGRMVHGFVNDEGGFSDVYN